MSIDFHQVKKTLHAKLDNGIDQLKSAKIHLEDMENEAEASVKAKLSAAKEAVDAKKQDVSAAKARLEELVETKKSETKAAVAEWKTNHDLKKLEKRAERAEKDAEASVEVASFYTVEAQVAILEAVAARKDFDDAL
jgi:hypothetical protein